MDGTEACGPAGDRPDRCGFAFTRGACAGRDPFPRLTTEERRKGALRTNEIRRQKQEEAKQTALDRLTEKLEAHADEILEKYMEAIRNGEWRAGEALCDRAYGHEVETPALARPQTMQEVEPELRALEQEYGEGALSAPELPEYSGG